MHWDLNLCELRVSGTELTIRAFAHNSGEKELHIGHLWEFELEQLIEKAKQ